MHERLLKRVYWASDPSDPYWGRYVTTKRITVCGKKMTTSCVVLERSEVWCEVRFVDVKWCEMHRWDQWVPKWVLTKHAGGFEAPAYHVGLMIALQRLGHKIVDTQYDENAGEDTGECFLESIAHSTQQTLDEMLERLCDEASSANAPKHLRSQKGWKDIESLERKRIRIQWLPKLLNRRICIVSETETRFYGDVHSPTIVLGMHPKDGFGTRHVDPCVPISDSNL